MSTTTILAISTPVVAIAGYVFVYRSASRDRVAARELARDSRDHEIDARRRERAYEARKEAYRIVLQWALRTMQQVQLTNPILTFAGTPAPPENVAPEVFDSMNVELAAFGSPEVRQEVEEFRDAVDSFFARNATVVTMQQQSGPGQHVADAFEARDAARQAARDAFDELAAAINEDLSTL